ncbi:CRTAC1 family protein [Aurantibacter sp.]|uniref:CRTAC1 family protein n=1 Tax=Aurantibacter sp. TaxID=2807103 RepID=UPI0032661065
MLKISKILIIATFYAMIFSCNEKNTAITIPATANFTLLDSSETNIHFNNDLPFNQEFNVYTYRNYYNGGGVAIGDVNNDGLADVYLTANAKKNKLFLNKGDFKFEEISTKSATIGNKAWSTGVTMVDINADGFLDIYVCNSGDVHGDNKQNELFINNGDLTFTEKAEEYGLADQGFSTHASFFDFDKDGDLDVYILNNSYQAIGSFNLKKNERPKRDEKGGDKLMENIDGKFVDVSKKAGIYGSIIGFGLGVTVGDTNNDGWEDIYVSNDFFERDYLYINQKNGTFSEVLTQQMKSISGASMGADMADINNDGNNDIFVTEMLPKDYQRLKTVTTFENWDKYQYSVKNGYYHQFTRNMLQLNNGNNTYSEVGRFSGIEASDWSWGALFFDMDNDGLKDLFIANGVYQDLTDQDYLQYISNEEIVKSIVNKDGIDYKKLIKVIPSNKVVNQAYKNLGHLDFQLYKESGLLTPSFSNGSAYGDLDNDGDLDLIINNVNSALFVYKNNTSESTQNNYIKLKLNGDKKNTHAIGAKVQVYLDNDTLYYEMQPTRGFQSSMDYNLTIGIGASKKASLRIIWPNNKTSFLPNITLNSALTLNQTKANETFKYPRTNGQNIFSKEDLNLTYRHKENNYVDFNRDRLLNTMLSSEGPKMTIGDVDNDGRSDIFIGSSKGFSPTLLFNKKNGWKESKQKVFDINAISEDSESLFFDADNDNDLDLYVCSGSVEFSNFSSNYHDRLYINDGKGNFSVSSQKLPLATSTNSTSTVTAADIDDDGDLDLFVGERVIPSKYGVKGSGFLLLNNGNGNFIAATEKQSQVFKNLGMVTDAQFIDLDKDKDPDLVVVGEFMNITFFKNENGVFSKVKETPKVNGWWNTLHSVDIDGDGDLDLVVGNHGLNSRFRATDEQPIKLFLNDFDTNGRVDPIMTFTAKNGKDYPFALRHDLIDQIKELKKKFPDYKSFENASITEIFDDNQLQNTTISIANTLETTLLINEGNFKFVKSELPSTVQYSPIYAIESGDFDNDGDVDLILGGNLYKAKPEVGRYDASYGLFIENKGNLNFVSTSNNKGFKVDGEIRSIKKIPNTNTLIVTRNNDSLVQFSFK